MSSLDKLFENWKYVDNIKMIPLVDAMNVIDEITEIVHCNAVANTIKACKEQWFNSLKDPIHPKIDFTKRHEE